MIGLITWATPNEARSALMLGEIRLAYTVRLVDLAARAQSAPEFLAISPNNKIPSLIDRDQTGGRHVPFGSGAVLIYLAEKSRRLLAGTGRRRDIVLSWLCWSTSGLGPTPDRLPQQVATSNGQARPEDSEREVIRLMRVLEEGLNEPFVVDEYSNADIAAFGWLKSTFYRDSDSARPAANLSEEHCRWAWRRCGQRTTSSTGPRQDAVTEGCTP